MGSFTRLIIAIILLAALAGCALSDLAAPSPTAIPQATATPLPPTVTPTRAAPTATSPARSQPVATASRVALPAITGTQAPIARLVSVGKYRLYLACTGTGYPTVVMDSGLGAGSSQWSFIAPKIAGTRVCVYDRANTGRSDHAPTPRTSQDLVDDLHTLLANAGVSGPYVLVGHSLGGLDIRLFAGEYPASVAGMVLVDAAHEDLWNRLLSLIPAPSAGEPPELKVYRTALTSAEGSEQIDLKASGDQVRARRAAAETHGPQFGAMPLIVISHGKPIAGVPPLYSPIVESIWSDMQLDLLNLSTNSRQVIAEQSGHDVPADQPQLVIDATREIVRDARGQ